VNAWTNKGVFIMARCIVTVVGMADRMTGTSSKTGNPYDLCDVAFTFFNQWGKNAVACAMIDGAVLDQMGVSVGSSYDAVVNQYNGKTYVDLIDEVK
jgi:hypothetical protein